MKAVLLRSVSVSPPAHAPVLRLQVRRWGVLGALAGALLSLVVFAPAHWVAGALARLTEQHLVLWDPRGTVWTGSAKLLFTGGKASQDRALLAQRVQWQLRPTSQGLLLKIFVECCSPRPLEVQVRPQRGGVEVALTDGLSSWPAGLLTGLGSPWNSLQPAGTLVLDTRQVNALLQAGQWQFAGEAVVEARDISSALSPLRPMGTYRIHIKGGSQVQLRLETLQGGLQLGGSGQWLGSGLQFSGEASAQPGREEALNNFLNIIGQRNGDKSIITRGHS